MNLLWSRKYICILLVLFISCKRGQDELAGSIQPKIESLKTLYQDSLSLKTTLIKYDPIGEESTYGLLVGNYADQTTGQITANAFTAFGLLATHSTFGPNPYEDSIKLTIIFDHSYIYGRVNINDPIQINVHRLVDNVEGGTNYNISDAIAYDPTPLTSFYLYANKDTVIVPLSNVLGKEFMNDIDFSNIVNFQNQFKGLAFINAGTNNKTIRRILYSNIVLYFHNFYALNNLEINDTRTLISSFYTLGYSNLGLNQFLINRSRSDLYVLKPNGYDSLPSQKCFVQPNTGIYTKIEFPSLFNFKNSVPGKLLIDRAEIIITPTQSSIDQQVPSMFAYLLTNDRKIDSIYNGTTFIKHYLQNEAGTTATVLDNASQLGISYDPINNNFTIPITGYLQAVLDGKLPNNGLLLRGGNQSINPYIISTQTPSYAVLDKTVFYNNKSGIKLKIYYTIY